MKKKKWISAFLAVVMVLMMTPAVVFAAGGESDFSQVYFGTNTDHKNDTTATENFDGGGSAAWDAATATLTLENANMSGCIDIRATDPSETVTIVLKGNNSITAAMHTIYVDANLYIRAEEGASLTLDARPYSGGQTTNGINTTGTLTIENGTYNITSGATAVYAGEDINIIEGANIEKIDTDSTAIYAEQNLKISGNGTSVTANDTYYCVLLGKAGVTISDGAKVTGSSVNDHAVYTGNGGIAVDNAEVDLSSGEDGGVAFYVGNADQTLSITNSTVNVKTSGTSLFSMGKIEIGDSSVDIESGANPIYAKKELNITGKNTNIDSTGKNPIASDAAILIDGATVKANATAGTAITSSGNITIQGGADVTAKTSANMSAIYSSGGNILFDGMDTKVTAVSEGDSAVFTRNGTITLNAGKITATAEDGFAPFTARKSGQSDTQSKPDKLIIVGENFDPGDNIIASTVWKTGSDGTYYSDTIFVPADTKLNEDGLLSENYQPEDTTVSVGVKSADYTAVDAAIAKAQGLNKADYEDFSAVENAIAAVVRDKKITEQAEVDAMAKAIEDAIAGLKVKFYPEIIAGMNSTWQQGGKEGLSFTSNAAFSDFLKVQVDGKDLASSAYDVKEGSTIVTLKASYLATLSVGKHTLAIVSSTGTAATEFTVKAAAVTDTENSQTLAADKGSAYSPQTGDDSHPVVWGVIVLAACVAVIAVIFIRKKRK